LCVSLTTALQDTNVLIAHNILTLHKNLALTLALHRFHQNSQLRLLAWNHDFAWTDPLYADELHAGEPWSLLRIPWQGVKNVVVSSSRQAELARLLDLAESEIAVVTPGLNPSDFFQLGATSAQWLEKFQLLDAAPLLLLPARVTRRKNIELAIDVTAELAAQGLNPRLLVMGPLGPHNPANRSYLDELRERRAARGVDDSVIFLDEHGTVDDVTRRDLYALADALLFPSAREGFGIPILEAGIARLPIFCAAIPPFFESAQSFATYFNLSDSPAQIAALVAGGLRDAPQYQLKIRVAKQYSWERIFADEIEPLLPSQEST
jgi:glycosyltransferase involved in cell wall biosynthesis